MLVVEAFDSEGCKVVPFVALVICEAELSALPSSLSELEAGPPPWTTVVAVLIADCGTLSGS